MTPTSNATNVLAKRFYSTGVHVLTGNASGRYIYTRDHLGSIREAWNMDTASLAVRYDYDPYGSRKAVPNSGFDTDLGFTGHYTHLGTGLVLAPFRAYDPKFGRWLSRDPIGEDGGLNLYGYVLNQPINAIDPLGLDYWFLNDSAAVLNQGHCASVVGNPDIGYDYYSKDGTKAGSTHMHFPSFEDFLNDPASQRYDRGVHVQTSLTQDEDMKSLANQIYNTPYSGTSNNCSNLSRSIMGGGGIDPHYTPFSISRPNGVYNSMNSSHVGNPVPIHPAPPPPPRPPIPLGY